MPVALPSAATFKARYPVFTTVGDALVGLVLAEAQRDVSDAWITGDQQTALMLSAAHTLASEGYPVGSGATAPDGAGGDVPNPSGQIVSAVQVGDVRTSFAKDGGLGGSVEGGVSASGYAWSSTIYGQRYMALLRRSFPAVMVIA